MDTETYRFTCYFIQVGSSTYKTTDQALAIGFDLYWNGNKTGIVKEIDSNREISTIEKCFFV